MTDDRRAVLALITLVSNAFVGVVCVVAVFVLWDDGWGWSALGVFGAALTGIHVIRMVRLLDWSRFRP